MGFGYGGANVHLILQQAPDLPAPGLTVKTPNRKQSEELELPQSHQENTALLVLSAKNQDALLQLGQDWLDWLESQGKSFSIDALQSQSTHRANHFEHRMAVVVAITKIGKGRFAILSPSLKRAQNSHATHRPGQSQGGQNQAVQNQGIVFACCGQGPQSWNMGRGLYTFSPSGRAMLEACDREFSKHGSWSLLEELHRSQQLSRMQRTAIAQPALFAFRSPWRLIGKIWNRAQSGSRSQRWRNRGGLSGRCPVLGRCLLRSLSSRADHGSGHFAWEIGGGRPLDRRD